MLLWPYGQGLGTLVPLHSEVKIMVVLYGYKVLCPTGISQKPWVGRTGMVTVVKRMVRMVMAVETHVH